MADRQRGQRRVLVTRPVLQAEPLLDALQAAQWQAVALPMLDIAPRRDPATQAQLAQVLQSQALLPSTRRAGRVGALAIFVSTNAVSCTAQLLDAAGLAWPQALACIGIGPATQAAIAARGWPQFDEFTASASEPCAATPSTANSIAAAAVETDAGNFSDNGGSTYNSAELLANLSGLAMQGRNVIVFSGVGGRREIDTELARRGAQLARVETYQRLRPVYSEAEFSACIARFLGDLSAAESGYGEPGSAYAMLFASGATLENFFWYAQRSSWLERLCATVVIVPSERVAQLGRQAGLQRVIVAGNASQQAFLHALRSL